MINIQRAFCWFIVIAFCSGASAEDARFRVARIGIFDEEHTSPEGLNFSSANLIGEQGVVGRTANFSTYSAGDTLWYFDSASFTTTELGLTDQSYRDQFGRHRASPWAVNAGNVVGFTARVFDDFFYGADAWVYSQESGQTERIGLYDPATATDVEFYNYSDSPRLVNARGDVAGEYGNGFHDRAWHYDPTSRTTTEIGDIGPDPASVTESIRSRVTGLSDEGHVVGTASTPTRFSPVRAWHYNPETELTQEIGLRDRTVGSTSLEFAQNNLVVGSSYINAPNWYNNVWVFDPRDSTTSSIGLGDSGSGNDRFIQVLANGRILGETDEQPWLYDHRTRDTTPLGLVDSQHEPRSSWSARLTESGFIAGSSNFVDGGRSAWYYDPNTNSTRQLGFVSEDYVGRDGFRQSTIYALSENGFAAGESERRVSRYHISGADAWLFDPNQDELVRIGENLKGPISPYRVTPQAVNNNGQVAGEGNSGTLGNVVWYYDHTTGEEAKIIGLLDDKYRQSEYSGFKSEFIDMNENGQVVGYSHVNGQIGWFFDPTTDLTTPLVFSGVESGRANTRIETLDENGEVFGYYQEFDDFGNSLGLRPFLWDQETGLTDILTSIVVGDPPEDDFSYSRNGERISTSDLILASYNGASGFNTAAIIRCELTDCPDADPGNANAVPEPGSAVVFGGLFLCLAAATFMRKR